MTNDKSQECFVGQFVVIFCLSSSYTLVRLIGATHRFPSFRLGHQPLKQSLVQRKNNAGVYSWSDHTLC